MWNKSTWISIARIERFIISISWRRRHKWSERNTGSLYRKVKVKSLENSSRNFPVWCWRRVGGCRWCLIGLEITLGDCGRTTRTSVALYIPDINREQLPCLKWAIRCDNTGKKKGHEKPGGKRFVGKENGACSETQRMVNKGSREKRRERKYRGAALSC